MWCLTRPGKVNPTLWSLPMNATATLVCTHPAHASMLAIVDSIVEHYRTDFTTHDTAQMVACGASNPFVWFAGKSGSHMYSRASVMAGTSSGWREYTKCILSVARDNPDGSGWYCWNGYTFRKIGTGGATALVAKWASEATPETDKARDARHRRGAW